MMIKPEALHPDRTTLVVIDLQEKLPPAVDQHERVLHHARLLLRLARVLELPVLLTTQYAKGLGPTVPDVLAETAGATPIDKTAFGCFGSEAFDSKLKGLEGRSQLLVAGV